MRRITPKLLSLFVFVCTLSLCLTATACPTCKDSMVYSNQNGIQLGYYWSILFMMAMPFSILGGWVFYVWRVVRQRQPIGKTDSHLPLQGRPLADG